LVIEATGAIGSVGELRVGSANFGESVFWASSRASLAVLRIRTIPVTQTLIRVEKDLGRRCIAEFSCTRMPLRDRDGSTKE
jgi:hypothetical protein